MIHHDEKGPFFFLRSLPWTTFGFLSGWLWSNPWEMIQIENPKPRDIHLYPMKTNLWKLIIISQLSDHHFNSMLYSPFLMVTSSFFISITKIIATGWYLYCIFYIFSSFPTFTIWVLKNDAVVFCFGPATNYSGRCVAKGLQRFASEEVV